MVGSKGWMAIAKAMRGRGVHGMVRACDGEDYGMDGRTRGRGTVANAMRGAIRTIKWKGAMGGWKEVDW